MNKRQRKKLYKILFKAVKALNDDIAITEGQRFVTDKEVDETVRKIMKSRKAISETMRDYKKYILNK